MSQRSDWQELRSRRARKFIIGSADRYGHSLLALAASCSASCFRAALALCRCSSVRLPGVLS